MTTARCHCLILLCLSVTPALARADDPLPPDVAAPLAHPPAVVGPVVPGPPVYSLDYYASLSWYELECLYRQAHPGVPPCGFVAGRAVYCPCRPCAGLSNRMARTFWKGKHFGCGTVINQWAGFRLIRAEVYQDCSWLDGRPATILDYRGTSRLWRTVRDELRELAPGLYIGIMYVERDCAPEARTFFILQASPCGP